MESVAIVMACEEEFGICIPDAVAEKMRTPRDLIDFVLEERRRLEQVDCQAHVMQSLAQMGYPAVTDDTHVRVLFRRKGAVLEWGRLARLLEPFSVPPARGTNTGCLVACMGLIALVICLVYQEWLAAGIAALAWIGGRAWDVRSLSFPKEIITVRSLVDHLARQISPQEIAEKVSRIIIEELGIDEGQYGEQKRFIEDLGMG